MDEAPWLNTFTGTSQGSFDKLYLRGADGTYTDLLTLLGTAGEGVAEVIGGGLVSIVTNGDQRQVVIDLSGYSTSVQAAALLVTALTPKIDTLTASTGITISGTGATRTIATTVTPLALTLDSVAQAATALNFVGTSASLDGGVLSVSRMAWQDKVVLRYGGSSTDKDLTQSATGGLLWNGVDLINLTAQNSALSLYPLATRLLTDVPVNALFSDTVYTKPAAEAIAYITGLQAALDAKLATTHESNNIGTGIVDLGAFGVTARRVTLDSTSGDSVYLINNDADNISIEGTSWGANAILVSAPMLAAQLSAFTLTSALAVSLITQTLALTYSTNSVGSLTAADNGDLHWKGEALAIDSQLGNVAASIAAQLVDKEDNLSFYLENSGTSSTIAEYFDSAPTPTHIPWQSGFYADASTHQTVTLASANVGVWHSYNNSGTGEVYVSLEIKAGTVDHVVMSINGGNNWGEVRETKIENLSTSVWTTVTWSFPIPSTGHFNWHLGIIPDGSSFTQGVGTILIKNTRFHKTTATSTISALLTCQEDVICERGVTAVSFLSTSDQSVKSNVQDASIDDCFEAFQNIQPKTYTRTDIVGGTRLGFIAQDVDDAIPEEFLNLIGHQYGGSEPLMQLDYSRLVVLLWGACKRLEARIVALE
jgi:hypothetical protein